MRRLPWILLLLLTTTPLARAQQIDLSSGGPVEVTARDGFEWREAERVVIATGEARAVRGNVTVLADRLMAYYRNKDPAGQRPAAAPGAAGIEGGENEIYRLEAVGHVRIVTPSDEAVGDKAVYDIDQAVLVMTGQGLKLTTPQYVMTARDSMEYWSQQHMAVGRGNALVVATDGRRLSGDVLVGYTSEGAASGKPATPARTGPAPAPAESSGKLERVEAYGNVEVRTQTDIVRGDRGVYVPDSGMARVLGHVRITHGQNQMTGAAADVNMKTGIAHVISDPGARVQGLIMPNEAQQPGRAQPAPRAPGAAR
ncbi:OstA-like_N domain-containing protein [Rhodovastum atsumiense]|uniref:Organic solvent tolerance-like N-terminal domain-containing protein n=1 Tax=Rhodovastum atsumiense TaxID=504468 RepID=A0A5M6J3V1_9PROT|nr:LptA/OstA family protein [Rhodovastum atsumiense]KAA5614335.1 hypothetical protein F1189_01725 [Rhodovastum atsumiense]CAH2604803.1 OstA-like_N domain-containing protein [Rhodovastum atsumiense]